MMERTMTARSFAIRGLCAAFLMGLGAVAQAQSAGDAIKQHLRNKLEPNTKRPAVPAPETSPEPPSPVEPPQTATVPAPDQNATPSAPPGSTFRFSTDDRKDLEPVSDLPRRIFGKYFKLDLNLDGGYRGWVPQQYQGVKVNVAGYYTWSAEAKAKIWFLSVHRGYYESNALASPRTEEAAVAAQIGSHIPQAAWAMAFIGIPILKVWEPIIRYEARSFNTSATPKIPVCLVTRETASDLATCPRSTQALNVISSFETVVLGIQYNADQDKGPVVRSGSSSFPPIYAGVGLMSYRKPYQVNVNGDAVDDLLFDGRFRGAGLALGGSFDGGLKRFYGQVNLQMGLGQIRLTQDLTLNQLAPADWLIGYVQGDVGLGYRFVLMDGPPTVIFSLGVTGGGASFHFFKTKAEAGEKARTPNLNWDFLWSARAAVLIPI